MPTILSQFSGGETINERANKISEGRRRNELAEIAQPLKVQQLQGQARDSDIKRGAAAAVDFIGALGLPEGFDPSALSPEDLGALNQNWLSAKQASAQLGHDVERVPDEFSPQWFNAAQGLVKQAGLQDKVKFGRVVQGRDAEGNPVFAATKDGVLEVLEGVTPLDDAGKKREEEKRKEEEGKKSAVGKIQRAASSFAEALSSPQIESATGLKGAVVGNLSAIFGGDAGIVKRKLDRSSRKLVTGLAKTLGVNPTDSDIKLLMETIPGGADDVEIWRDWYENDFLVEAQELANEKGIEIELPSVDSLFGRSGAKTAPAPSAQTTPEGGGDPAVNELLNDLGIF